MSGLMDKAKDALKGNDKAQGFADKQVTSRTFNPPISILHSATKLTFVCRGRQVHRRPWHGMGEKYDKKISAGINKQTNDQVFHPK